MAEVKDNPRLPHVSLDDGAHAKIMTELAQLHKQGRPNEMFSLAEKNSGMTASAKRNIYAQEALVTIPSFTGSGLGLGVWVPYIGPVVGTGGGAILGGLRTHFLARNAIDLVENSNKLKFLSSFIPEETRKGISKQCAVDTVKGNIAKVGNAVIDAGTQVGALMSMPGLNAAIKIATGVVHGANSGLNHAEVYLEKEKTACELKEVGKILVSESQKTKVSAGKLRR